MGSPPFANSILFCGRKRATTAYCVSLGLLRPACISPTFDVVAACGTSTSTCSPVDCSHQTRVRLYRFGLSLTPWRQHQLEALQLQRKLRVSRCEDCCRSCPAPFWLNVCQRLVGTVSIICMIACTKKEGIGVERVLGVELQSHQTNPGFVVVTMWKCRWRLLTWQQETTTTVDAIVSKISANNFKLPAA